MPQQEPEEADAVRRLRDENLNLRIDNRAKELAIAELDRLHKSLGFRGIEIMTHVAGEDLSADRFRRIFARCEELGLLVFMHPDGFTEYKVVGQGAPRTAGSPQIERATRSAIGRQPTRPAQA